MNLSERLRNVVIARKDNRPWTQSSPAAPAGSADAGSGEPASVEDALGGAWSSRAPACFVVDRQVAADEFHGSARVRDSATKLNQSCFRASLLTRTAETRLPFVFFDLETTGLSGGAGTYAFLIGFGWFADAGAFETRQYLLTDYTSERPMLEAAAADLERAGVLVSFNGKSFDAPLLETRFLFHRLDWAGDEIPHLDLLHPARRFWGGATGDSPCSLGALERRLVSVFRQHDVPGSEIPSRYFEFLRSGDAGPLSRVLEHNRQDLLSLAVLTSRLLDIVDAGPDSTEDAREALALGHVYANGGMEARARQAYRRAVALSESASGEEDVVSALRSLAVTERRARAFDEAAECWQRLLEVPSCPPHIACEALEALAIHHEHRRRDLATAKAFALRSLHREARQNWHDGVRHRLARLEKKLERASEPPLFPSSTSRPSSGFPMSGPRTSS